MAKGDSLSRNPASSSPFNFHTHDAVVDETEVGNALIAAMNEEDAPFRSMTSGLGKQSKETTTSNPLNGNKQRCPAHSPKDNSPGEESDHAQERSSGKRKRPETTGKRRRPRKSSEERLRRAPENVAESIPIPKTMEEFSDADRAMWDMRKDGKGWEEIRAEWERLTGQKVATTTLPNRYIRLKENIGDFTQDDDDLMLECKANIERLFTSEIWVMISEAMTSKGGNKFSGPAIQRRFRQLTQEIKEEEED